MDFAEFDIEFLAQKLAENPRSSLFARLADLYIGKEQTAEAMQLLEEGIKLFPDYYAGYIVLGKAHLAFKEYSRAQSAFEKALELSPFNQTAAQLLISVPNKPDESTRTTDENYFNPSTTGSVEQPSVMPQSLSSESSQEGSPEVSSETPDAEDLGFTQQADDTAGSPQEQTYVHASLFDTPPEDSGNEEKPLQSYDDYFAQNQPRINTQSPISLDDYLSGKQPLQNTVTGEENTSHDFTNDSFVPSEPAVPEVQQESHVEPEPVFASPEQEQLFAEMNAMNEGSSAETLQSSTDIDSLAEKLQGAEKIVPQENYQPQNPIPQETKDDQAYETDAVTPTLAEIYASQGEYRAAIQAYEILMFSQPAKGGEYQQRIRELQQKQMEKDGLV